MILKYGNYAHQQNEVKLDSIQRSAVRSSGFVRSITETWTISGRIQADTQADLTTALLALESAYYLDGGDLIFYLDDGTTETAHSLKGANTYGGVRVVSPVSYPNGDSAEYSTFRNYSITLEADLIVTAANLIDYSETLQFKGTGGPEITWVETINTDPVPQMIRPRTVCFCTQSGQLTSASAGYRPPPPRFPEYELVKERSISYGTPKRIGAGGQLQFTDFPISWSYSFAAGQPFPNVAPVWQGG